MKIIIKSDAQEASQKTAELIIETINKNPHTHLGLATGGTMESVYAYLVNAYRENRVSFKEVATFNLDEYIGLSDSHPASFLTFMKTHFFNHIDIDLANVHFPIPCPDHPNTTAKQYNETLKNAGIDLQILGLGTNGHIGFNEPNTSFEKETHIVSLDPQTRKDNARFFNAPCDVPTHAVTMGIKNIMHAKTIILLATGSHKSTAVYEMVKGPVVETLPASILQLHPNFTLILDEDAAQKLH